MIDQCICHEVSFEKALKVARARGCETVEELKRHLDICDSCEICRPYLQEMLDTGQTEFDT